MHHDGTSRNQATHGYSPFFQVSHLKNKVMDASGDRISSIQMDIELQKMCLPGTPLKRKYYGAVIQRVFPDFSCKLRVFSPAADKVCSLPCSPAIPFQENGARFGVIFLCRR